MYWGVPAEVEIGYTSWWNLINQSVNGLHSLLSVCTGVDLQTKQ